MTKQDGFDSATTLVETSMNISGIVGPSFTSVASLSQFFCGNGMTSISYSATGAVLSDKYLLNVL